MTATYTFDIFTSIDGFGSYVPPGDWGGYWGKQGPELLEHRLAAYAGEQRMVLGANTYRAFASMLAAAGPDDDVRDAWVDRMRALPAYVVSSTLQEPLDWPDATVLGGDPVEEVAPPEGGVRRPDPLARQPHPQPCSHGGRAGRPPAGHGLPGDLRSDRQEPIFAGAADFDLDLLEHRVLDGRTTELVYRPTLRTWDA